MFLLLATLVWWGPAQAAMDEKPGVSFCHETLLLIFLNPLLNAYLPADSSLKLKAVQTRDSSFVDRASEPVEANSLISLYSILPGILQWGVAVSRIGEMSRSTDSGLGHEEDDDGMEEDASHSVRPVSTGGDDHNENNGDERKDKSEDKKNPCLCWHCQKNGVSWQYSCCRRGLCEDCYQCFGASPARCPCCGKKRRPGIHCNLCPVDHEPMELDQQGVREHLTAQHLQQRCVGVVNEFCHHCNHTEVLQLPLQQLLNTLSSHCYALCFESCFTILTAETDNTAHFEASHRERAGCPLFECPFNESDDIRPTASHMNEHLQYRCGFCFETISNQQALQTHLATHIDSYRCGSCLGDEGEGSLLRLILMGGRLQQIGNANFTVDLPLGSQQELINHWAFFHCQISCPLCSHTLQGCDNVSMQEHIDSVCSRVDCLSGPEQKREL